MPWLRAIRSRRLASRLHDRAAGHTVVASIVRHDLASARRLLRVHRLVARGLADGGRATGP